MVSVHSRTGPAVAAVWAATDLTPLVGAAPPGWEPTTGTALR
jgi:hypothetical protein